MNWSSQHKAFDISNKTIGLHVFRRESHDWLITTEHTRETAIARAVRCLQALVKQRSDLWDERCDATQEEQQRPDTDRADQARQNLAWCAAGYVFRFLRDIHRLRADTLSASIECNAAVLPRSVEVMAIEGSRGATVTLGARV